jgi:two-component system phosphate regulon sensor histidine kinase PhoR
LLKKVKHRHKLRVSVTLVQKFGVKKIRINLIVVLVSVAVLALLVIQFFQTAQLYDRKSTQFKAKVVSVLDRIAIRHEKAEDIRKYMNVVNKDFSGQYKEILKKEFQNLLDAQESVMIKDTFIIQNAEIQKYLIIKGKSFDSLSGISAEHRVFARDVKQLRELFNRESGMLPENDSASVSVQLDHRVMQQIFRKSKYINDMMIQAFRDNVYTEPSERIDIVFLDSIIAHEIKHEELPSDFEFLIVKEDGSPIRYKHPTKNYIINLDTTKVAYTNLFPGNFLDEQLKIYIDFPTRKSFVVKEIFGLLTISLGLVILIIVALSFMFRTIITQKKLSEMRNDFINNMTHEFKTPISTISLACEAMGDKEMMAGDLAHASIFVKMIDDENKRLGVLVERILQTAILDRGELKLKFETINFTELVKDVCEHAVFRLQSVNGELNEIIPQESIFIVGDRMHTTNVVSNLIDNAIKYSKENPSILVSLKKEGARTTLSIKDYGIGISKEHISKIFDKLYRIPTGNLHNVKGFGLGLSYVKSIVESNGWNIEVKSKLNEGSEFTLIIID